VISRRSFLSQSAATAAAAAAAGLTLAPSCARNRGRRLEIAVVWSDGELDRFREVLRAYPEPVDVTSAGDDIGAFLNARHRAGNSPDLAVLPFPGLMRQLVADSRLTSIPETDVLRDRYPRAWLDLLKIDGVLYGVWVKAAHKSLFWRLPTSPIAEADTWEGLVSQVDQAAGDPDLPAPLAIGAADGWVLTDWLENLLAARLTCDTYHRLSRGHDRWHDGQVVKAFGDLFDMWHGPGRFPGGASRALLTQHEEAVLQVFGTKTALTVFEGDFVTSVIGRFAEPGDPQPEFFPFPAPAAVEGEQPLVVGGDAAVLLNDSQGAADLLAWLTEPDSFAPWMAAGGFLIPNQKAHDAHRYHDPLQRRLAQQLLDATEPRFDLSDLLSGTLGGADGQGSWRFLQDFFLAATQPRAERQRVVAEVTARFSAAARHYEGSKSLDRHACS